MKMHMLAKGPSWRAFRSSLHVAIPTWILPNSMGFRIIYK